MRVFNVDAQKKIDEVGNGIAKALHDIYGEDQFDINGDLCLDDSEIKEYYSVKAEVISQINNKDRHEKS